ncbi:SDR family oxidoreductase [Roseovarius sp. CAU 1744]|uniref:SDR family oxidoreductase n=1 Tax=Roseovarius sp. CAU 1744 TaxID=3140368 RepID=UPI00325BE7D8
MIDLTGKTAIITGASRGIGLATARKLSLCGANVVLAARSDDAIRHEADALSAAGRGALAVACDVARYADLAAVFERTIAEFGAVDILVNNAGVIDPIARLEDADPEIWSTAVDINFKGVFYGLRLAIPHMLERGQGVIINLSSGAANSALEGWSHYCSTKVAARKLTECAHQEVGDKGVRVVGLSPGTVATGMMEKIRASGVNAVSQLDWSVHKPPEWAAEAVAFLCGPEGAEFAGDEFSIKTKEGLARLGLLQTEA